MLIDIEILVAFEKLAGEFCALDLVCHKIAEGTVRIAQ